MNRDLSTTGPRRIAAGALLLAIVCAVLSEFPWVPILIALAASVFALAVLYEGGRGWAAPAPRYSSAPHESVVVIETGHVTVRVFDSGAPPALVGRQVNEPEPGWLRLPGEGDAVLNDGEG
ncbi:MAG: hypothetical protein AB7V62_05790 [Thermoleophilia bacterium]